MIQRLKLTKTNRITAQHSPMRSRLNACSWWTNDQ